jgi:hypothetical protein
VNIRAEPRTEIAGAPVISIPPINKPCWLGWFEFTDTLAYLPPSNANLWVKQGGPIKDAAGMQFALWVQGGSVAEIDAKVAQSSWPCVAYWDGRTWPSWPSLRSGDWLAIQAYCWSSETPTAFGLNVQAMIHAVPSSYAQIALVCQCYTSNTGLTTALASLVPVYAQLARDNPRVTMLLVFTDQGRATGLCDHPEIRK